MNKPAKTFLWMHLHQCQYLYQNENEQSMPILVSGNATREQIPSPGQRRVVDSVSRGVAQPKTGVRWSRVDCTENDTSAIPKTVSFSKIQLGHTLGYLNNREDVLKDSGENVPFFGNGSDRKYYDEKAHLVIDFANHAGGSRPGIIVFDEIDEQRSSTRVIREGILKIMSVQSIRVDIIPVVIIIILLKIAHVTNPDHFHHESCSLKKMLTGKLWTKIEINAEN